jgi:Pentapeptide repeats (8 copies)
MANQEQLDLLKLGVDAWNRWREKHLDIHPDLIEVDLSEADLSYVNLSEANLYQANLYKANLFQANLSKANLHEANFYQANLHEADLSKASLGYAHLTYATLTHANLSKADLRRSSLVDTNLSHADLTNCSVYGISVWNIQTEGAIQDDLVITRRNEPIITVDNLEVAQFIYLLLNNKKIRDVIDTITSKVALVLGRFTEERKKVLDALREELRQHNYTPVVFDFEKPASRDLTETVSTLAHLARFIIVDLTDPSSAPHEVATIIPQCIVPVQPLLLQDDTQPGYEYAMFHDLRTRYHWVLPTYQYQDISSLLASLKENIIEPAEQKAQELAQR